PSTGIAPCRLALCHLHSSFHRPYRSYRKVPAAHPRPLGRGGI
ncbi:hypothetical protein BN1723_017343, partial [Verticillium longisporum]